MNNYFLVLSSVFLFFIIFILCIQLWPGLLRFIQNYDFRLIGAQRRSFLNFPIDFWIIEKYSVKIAKIRLQYYYFSCYFNHCHHQKVFDCYSNLHKHLFIFQLYIYTLYIIIWSSKYFGITLIVWNLVHEKIICDNYCSIKKCL